GDDELPGRLEVDRVQREILDDAPFDVHLGRRDDLDAVETLRRWAAHRRTLDREIAQVHAGGRRVDDDPLRARGEYAGERAARALDGNRLGDRDRAEA